MDGKVGNIMILPDQMQLINAALILMFIPLFDKVIYPTLTKHNLLTTPLQRIVTGGLLLASSFIISGMVELELEGTYPHPPGKINYDQYSVRFAVHNNLPEGCILNLTLKQDNQEVKKDWLISPGMSGIPRNDQNWDLLPNYVSEIDGFTFVTVEGSIESQPTEKEKKGSCRVNEKQRDVKKKIMLKAQTVSFGITNMVKSNLYH